MGRYRKNSCYKIDLWSVDEIRIDIEVSDRLYTITEEFHNWLLFVANLEKILAVDRAWLGEVMLPPFERNEKIIFERLP